MWAWLGVLLLLFDSFASTQSRDLSMCPRQLSSAQNGVNNSVSKEWMKWQKKKEKINKKNYKVGFWMNRVPNWNDEEWDKTYTKNFACDHELHFTSLEAMRKSNRNRKKKKNIHTFFIIAIVCDFVIARGGDNVESDSVFQIQIKTVIQYNCKTIAIRKLVRILYTNTFVTYHCWRFNWRWKPKWTIKIFVKRYFKSFGIAIDSCLLSVNSIAFVIFLSIKTKTKLCYMRYSSPHVSTLWWEMYMMLQNYNKRTVDLTSIHISQDAIAHNNSILWLYIQRQKKIKLT